MIYVWKENQWIAFKKFKCFQRRSEETAEIYAEKSRLKEEEALLTEHKAHTFKQEMDRLRESQLKTEKEKVELERKIRDAECSVIYLTEEKEQKTMEADKLKNELLFARDRERDATKQMLNVLSITMAQCSKESIGPGGGSSIILTGNGGGGDQQSSISNESNDCDDQMEASGDIEHITDEIEKNRYDLNFKIRLMSFIYFDFFCRNEYLAKSKLVQNQLLQLRSEIESLKIEENQTLIDIISSNQIRAGETKYSTLKKLNTGSQKTRVECFEQL